MIQIDPMGSLMQGFAVANMIRRAASEREQMERERIRQAREDEEFQRNRQAADLAFRERLSSIGRPAKGGLVEEMLAPPAIAGVTPDVAADAALPVMRKADKDRYFRYKSPVTGEDTEIERYTPDERMKMAQEALRAQKLMEAEIQTGAKRAAAAQELNDYGITLPGEAGPFAGKTVLPQHLRGVSAALEQLRGVPGRTIPLPPDVEEQQRRLRMPFPVPGVHVPLSADVEEQRKRIGASQTAAVTKTEAAEIGDAIMRGEQSPDMKGMYRLAGPVRAHLARNGYNLARAQSDWNAVQRHLATLNGPQQERLRQAVTFAYDSLDVIEGLFNEWKAIRRETGIPVLNKASLAVAKQLPGKAGEVARALESHINYIVSELATVYKGGNSSTDESLKLASENLKAHWNSQQFERQLEMIRKDLAIRKNSILTSRPVGVTAGSPYVPHGQAAPDEAAPENDPLRIRDAEDR